MSQTLELRIKEKISKYKLCKEIDRLWYKKNGPNEYFYYEEKDFKSLWAIRLSYTIWDWKTFITTTSGWLRYFWDIEKQNDTIRQLKKTFWGYLYNDWTEWTYIQWWEKTKLKTIERACWLSYHKFYTWMCRAIVIKWAIKWDMKEYMPWISEYFPDWNIALMTIPFLVSITEDFLKTFLSRYIEYSKSYIKLGDKKIDRKFKISEIEDIYAQKKSVWELISNQYNFQNLKSINEAYTTYWNLNIFTILNKKKKLKSGKYYNLLTVLTDVISKRHRIIHEAEFIHVTKDELSDYIEVFFLVWKEITNYYNKEYWYKFDLNVVS